MFSFIMCLLISFSYNIFSIFEIDWIFWINLLFFSSIAMSLGTTIYFLASSKLGPKMASAFILLMPITALGFAIILLNEEVDFSTLVGGVFGIYAVYLINNTEERPN